MNRTDPHHARRSRLLAEHPGIKFLEGHDVRTAWYVAALLACSAAMCLAAHRSWALAVALGVTVGPYVDAGILAAIHELSHNLCTGSIAKDRLLGMLVNLPMLVPISEVFRQHHAAHHLNLGHPVLDVDTPLQWEIDLVGTSRLRKALWLLLNMLILPLRSLSKLPVRWNRFVLLNFATSLSCLAICLYFSPRAATCLLLSLFFSQGAHPANARQLQEHLWDGLPSRAVDAQGGAVATYSYYGTWNAFFLNVGYHREHHDCARVPWTRLPELKRMGGEAHYPASGGHEGRGWGDLANFVFNREVGLGNFFNAERGKERARTVRASKGAGRARSPAAIVSGRAKEQ
ncbi:fatty acid desaturase-domain-containing protein [Hyaloraphidium curvatum]|nr:fatty acid desaturase-domain-containing protein [Hyaloraphidium curvatum]